MSYRKSLFNKIAKLDNLELVKGEGYFYWWGLTDEMSSKLAGLFTTSVHVYKFSDLPQERWLWELEIIKGKLGREDEYQDEVYEFKSIPVHRIK